MKYHAYIIRVRERSGQGDGWPRELWHATAEAYDDAAPVPLYLLDGTTSSAPKAAASTLAGNLLRYGAELLARGEASLDDEWSFCVELVDVGPHPLLAPLGYVGTEDPRVAWALRSRPGLVDLLVEGAVYVRAAFGPGARVRLDSLDDLGRLRAVAVVDEPDGSQRALMLKRFDITWWVDRCLPDVTFDVAWSRHEEGDHEEG